MSRPSLYCHELAETICDRLADGESLVQICKGGDMPHRSTVLRWMASKPDFAAMYYRARQEQADYLFDEMARIEDDVEAGILSPDVARVVLSSKQWRAKLAPKKYGNHTTVDTNTAVAVTQTRRLDISTLTDEQLDALEEALRQRFMGSWRRLQVVLRNDYSGACSMAPARATDRYPGSMAPLVRRARLCRWRPSQAT